MPRRLAWATAVFVVFVLLPQGLIEFLISRIVEERERVLARSYQDRAKDLIGRLDLALDRRTLVDAGLQRFRRKAERLLRGKPLDPDGAGALTSLLRRRAPRDSLILWFGPDGRLLPPRGFPPPVKRKSWEALFAFLHHPGRIRPEEKMLAENLIRSSMGEIIDAEHLRGGFRETTSVLLSGKSNLMRILSLEGPPGRPGGKAPESGAAGQDPRPAVPAGDGQSPRRATDGASGAGATLGHVLVFLPTSRARFGWELERVVRDLSGPDGEVGGYWQSRQEGRGTDMINDNFMHGLFQMLENGQGFYPFEGMTCLSRFWSQDPDLVLVAGVRHNSAVARQAERIVTGVRVVVHGGAAGAGVVLAVLVFGNLSLRLSLATKLRLMVLFLAGFPCLTMLAWGGSHLVRLSNYRQVEMGKRLEGFLTNVEQHVAAGISQTQLELQEISATPGLRHIRTQAELEPVFRKLEGRGLYEAVYGRRGEAPLSITRRQADPSRTIRGPQFRALMAHVLKSAGIDLKESKSLSSADMEEMLSVAAGQRFPVDRLHLGQMAGDSGFFFVSLIKDDSGRNEAAMGVILAFPRFCRLLMEKWLRERRPAGCGVFLRSTHPTGIQKVPRERVFREILDRIEKNGERVFKPVQVGDRWYVVLGRPLPGQEAVGLAVLPFEEFSGVYPAAWRFMMMFGVLAFLGALFFSDLLVFLFLRPIVGLGEVIGRVEQGGYEVRTPVWPTDELGTLSTCFNRMIEGLQQKARMIPFLNRDLLEMSQVSPEVRIEPRRVTVSFAGIRAFGSLESRLSPDEAIGVMSEFLGRCELWVRRRGGEIDKFLGDAAMAVFWEPAPGRPEEQAVRAALDLRRDLDSWARERFGERAGEFRFGIGIAAGPVIAGHIGSIRKRLDFTVIGDAVNLAARLEKLANRNGNPPILATAEVFRDPLPGVRAAPTGIDTVRGRVGTVTVFGVEEDVG